jgi:ABC-type lipoprotein release transport system permease subunit
VLSLVLAALAGAVPAWRAASGGVREALQHE